MNPFVQRHQEKIAGEITCLDRVIITGTLPEICHARALVDHLTQRDIRLFDYRRWAEPFRDELRAHAEQVAAAAGLTIEFIRRHDAFPKEARIKAILAERFNLKALHRRLERWARAYWPVVTHFRAGYHWSLMQVELATDVAFHRQAELRPLYEALVRTAVHAVKADTVATFLGRKLTAAYSDELGNDFHTRIQGTRIRHSMARPASSSTTRPASSCAWNVPPTMSPSSNTTAGWSSPTAIRPGSSLP